jgi:hypothetical protein
VADLGGGDDAKRMASRRAHNLAGEEVNNQCEVHERGSARIGSSGHVRGRGPRGSSTDALRRAELHSLSISL